MESLYYVLCWHCHRRCKHCYEDRFHPYVREELEAVVSEAEVNAPRIVANLPESMMYKDRDSAVELDNTHAEPKGEYVEGGNESKVGRIILSGGDVLTEPVRERVLYPTLEAIRDKYKNVGGVKVVVQTTGDLLTPKIVDELLARDIWSISVSGMDDFHVGMQGSKKQELAAHVTAMFEAAGMQNADLKIDRQSRSRESGPVYNMFGATEDSWVGKLWPRGRAWNNDLSTATMADNFCNAWSGGLNFMDAGYAGSEVSIDPSGDVYPCCLKTAHPLGNLVEEPLLDILASLQGHPAFEAINAGKPERMGLAYQWSTDKFRDESNTTTPGGKPYANLCIGCDHFFKEVLAEEITEIRRQRRARRLGLVASSGK